MPASSPKVFLSYAHDDAPVAQEIAHELRAAGVTVESDKADTAPGDSLASQLTEAVRASDVLLVLLSPNSVQSDWVRQELSLALLSELSNRAVTVMTALIADCELPSSLHDRLTFDLRTGRKEGVRRLVEQLSALPKIDYTRLSYRDFESLVAALLTDLGYSIDAMSPGSAFDFNASYRSDGPFGPEETRWLVEVKLYQHGRFSVQTARELFGALQRDAVSHGLIVTNGQPTSAALEIVRDSEARTGLTIKLVDGVTLNSLLLERPHLVRRFFQDSP